MKCPMCGEATRQEMRTHHYTECGLPNVFIKDVPVEVCRCGEEYIQIPGMEEVDRRIGEKLLGKDQLLTGEEIRFLRKWLDLTSEEFAVSLGLKRATISRWENGKTPVYLFIDRLIRLYVAGVKGITQQIDHSYFFPATPLTTPTVRRQIEVELHDSVWETCSAVSAYFHVEPQGNPSAPSPYKAVRQQKGMVDGQQAANQELAQAA